MPESLKVNPSLSRSVPPAFSSGLGESLEARSEPLRGTMTEPHVISSEHPSSDESSSSRPFSSSNCLSMDFSAYSQNSAGCEENRLSDVRSNFSSCGPNNRLESYPLLLRVPSDADSNNPSHLPPGSGMPSIPQSATCFPFSTMATPQSLSGIFPSADFRHGDCREGIIYTYSSSTTSQDAECEASPGSHHYSSCDTHSPPHDITAIPNNRASSPERSQPDSGSPHYTASGFTGLASRSFPCLSSDALHTLSSSRPIPLAVSIPQDSRASSSPAFNVRVSVRPPSTYSHSRTSSIRSRRVSTDSRPLSPLDVTLRCHFSSDEADSLPALLSPSGTSQSERDRPSTPATFSDAGSQVTSSEDGRSRYIRPGTPIQTQLPEIEFLEATSYAASSSDVAETTSSILWFVPEEGISHAIQATQDDDEVVGDMGRAKELLDGLEWVERALVRRYEKIRGNGYDICAICRELLLPAPPTPRQATNFDPDSSWNLLASSVLPFNPTEEDEDCSIHAFPCAHLFHTDCLFPWLCIKTTCPTCRLDIDPHSLTLRVRGFDMSRFPHLDAAIASEPRYVNVDVLGRRIPWHRPQALSLEEWVQRRENTHRHRDEGRRHLGGSGRHGLRSSKLSRKSRLNISEDAAVEGRVVREEAVIVSRSQGPGISELPLDSTLRTSVTENSSRTEATLDDGIPAEGVATPRVLMAVGRQTTRNMAWSSAAAAFGGSPPAMPQTRSREEPSLRKEDDDVDA